MGHFPAYHRSDHVAEIAHATWTWVIHTVYLWYTVTLFQALTSLPFPEPRSAKQPPLPCKSLITFCVCTLLEGKYGTCTVETGLLSLTGTSKSELRRADKTEFHKCTFRSWRYARWIMFAWRKEPFTLLYTVPVKCLDAVERMSDLINLGYLHHYTTQFNNITTTSSLTFKTIHYCSSEKEFVTQAFIISHSLRYLLWRSANILSAIDHKGEMGKTRPDAEILLFCQLLLSLLCWKICITWTM